MRVNGVVDGGAVWGAGWSAEDVVGQFATEGHTDPGEAAALADVTAQAHGAVLDLGIGGGRTTGFLAATAREYVGIDVSPQMLALARRRFTGADLREGDARDLGDLPDGHFDLVVFSYNGLDSLDHEGRERALAEMARVLAPAGRLLFSSLNLDGVSFDEQPWRIAGGLGSRRVRYHVAEVVRRPSIAVRATRNYRRTRGESVDGDGWALRPMRAHEFRFVVHFATLGEMVRGVVAAGLTVVAAYDETGRVVDPSATSTDADYVHLVCERA